MVALLCSGTFLVGSAQDHQTIDATAQRQRPPRGRGPFPGSPLPGHSAGLPIRLELRIPTGELRPQGTILVDFMITNIGTEPIKLPSSVALFSSEPRESLTLWLTSDAIMGRAFIDRDTGSVIKIEIVEISAELDGGSDDLRSVYILAPNKSIRVRASSPLLKGKAGTYSFTAHAELARISNGTMQVTGTADSKSVITTLSVTRPTSR
jgi:hypothetical protein